jgi:hypothetical protein
MTAPNLWGDLSNLEAVRTPASILREQAQKLAELTNYTLKGDVSVDKYGDRFQVTLHIVAPALNDYRLLLIKVLHPIDIWPLEMRDVLAEQDYEASSEEEFVTVLGEILSSAQVKRVIAMLISQSGS